MDCDGDAAHPMCEADGSCGACIDSSSCSVGTPICDPASHECVGCMTSADCVSHVCNLGTQTCADPAQFAYVSGTGSDTGACNVEAPCRTIGYAYSELGARNQIFIVGSTYAAPATIVPGDGSVTITSEHATVTGGDPIFQLPSGNATQLTLRALTIGAAGSSPRKSLAIAAGSIVLDDVKLEQPFAVSAGGTLAIGASTVDADGSTAGSTSITKSSVHGFVTGSGGTLLFDSDHFQSTSGKAFKDNGGTTATFKNSVFVGTQSGGPILTLVAPSRVSFCTMVGNYTPTGTAIDCSLETGAMTIDNDVFAGLAMQACTTSTSLFSIGGYASGTNIVGDVNTFFVDLAGADFHLAATSPALHLAASGSTGVDLEGTARPTPANSMADVGAYESPN